MCILFYCRCFVLIVAVCQLHIKDFLIFYLILSLYLYPDSRAVFQTNNLIELLKYSLLILNVTRQLN